MPKARIDGDHAAAARCARESAARRPPRRDAAVEEARCRQAPRRRRRRKRKASRAQAVVRRKPKTAKASRPRRKGVQKKAAKRARRRARSSARRGPRARASQSAASSFSPTHVLAPAAQQADVAFAGGELLELAARRQDFGVDLELLGDIRRNVGEPLHQRELRGIGTFAPRQRWRRIADAGVAHQRQQFLATLAHHGLLHLRQRRQRFGGTRQAQHDLAQRHVVEDPAARPVAFDGAPLAPGGERLRELSVGGGAPGVPGERRRTQAGRARG